MLQAKAARLEGLRTPAEMGEKLFEGGKALYIINLREDAGRD
jgi:hypothetical protein